MPRTPNSAQPLLVPSPTSNTAPPFIMVGEEELAPYTSAIVSLPPTIPELIQCLEQQHERCAQMRGFVERVRVEAVKMAAAPLAAITSEALTAPATGTAASTPPPSQPLTPAGSPAAATTATSAGQSPTGNAIARGVVASAGNTASTTAPASTATATVVRGTVLTGTVVGVPGTAQSTAVPLRAAVVASASTTATPASGNTPAQPAAQSTEAGRAGGTGAAAAASSAISPDELQVLRAKAIGMEAAQHLLATTQDELRVAEHKLARGTEKLAKAEESLAELRREVTAKDTSLTGAIAETAESSQGSLFAQLQISLELSEAILSDTKMKHQSVLYTLAQLTEKMAVMTREKAFLEEKNTHLEGQLQRLLMSSMVGGPAAPARQQQQQQQQRAGTSPASAQSGAAAPASAPRLSASDAYQKSALERQIAELQGMTDKLTRDLRKQTARRAKAEETVQTLQQELTDLKASALQFRRQINESELELERAVSRKEDDERLRQLERDGTRLRTALRERTEHFLREKTEWEAQRDVLDARARVQTAASQQLLHRLFAYQVKEVVLRQCDHAATVRAGVKGTPMHTSPAGTPAKRAAASPTKVDTAGRSPAAASAQQSHHAGGKDRHLQQQQPLPPSSSPASDTSAASPLTTGPVGAAADTATLVNRERQLEELKNTFERRIALVDAQRGAEVRQLHALNKELRAALTTSQEELAQKARMLDTVQQQQQQQRQQPMPLAKFPTSLAAIPSTSSLSERRDTAAAWVCRTDGAYVPDASMDDLSDGVGGAYSSAHTPVVASPRLVTEIERRYDPERMSTWEAVQVENEALLDRLTSMQEEKWKLTSYVEDLQRQSNTLKDELRRNASTMNQLLAAGVLTPAAVSRGSAEGSLRALQCLLQETLQEKFALEEKVRSLGA